MRIYGSPPASYQQHSWWRRAQSRNYSRVCDEQDKATSHHQLIWNSEPDPNVHGHACQSWQQSPRRNSHLCSCFMRLGAWSVMRHKWPSESCHTRKRDPSADLSVLSSWTVCQNAPTCWSWSGTKFMLCISNKHRIHPCEAEISDLPIESTYLVNLLFSSCLHLRTMCCLSLIWAHGDDTWTHAYLRLCHIFTWWGIAQPFENLGCWSNSR